MNKSDRSAAVRSRNLRKWQLRRLCAREDVCVICGVRIVCGVGGVCSTVATYVAQERRGPACGVGSKRSVSAPRPVSERERETLRPPPPQQRLCCSFTENLRVVACAGADISLRISFSGGRTDGSALSMCSVVAARAAGAFVDYCTSLYHSTQ